MLMADNSDRSGANLNRTLVLRFLMRYGSVRRSALLDKLNSIAFQITHGNHGALTFNWAELRPEQLPWAGGSQLPIGLRELHAWKNALHSMLRDGVSQGVIDQQMYLSIVHRSLPRAVVEKVPDVQNFSLNPAQAPRGASGA